MSKVILINQILDTSDEEWRKYSCGICVLKMLMVFRKPELQAVSVKTLIGQALEKDGYVEKVGWKHQALTDLAALYGVPMGFQKEFFNTSEKKKEGIRAINSKINLGLPVAVSVLRDFNTPNTAHLVVVEGLKRAEYMIVDPYPGKRGNRYKVSRKEFLAGWRGGLIHLI